MISFALEEEQTLIQETVRRFAADLRSKQRAHEKSGVDASFRKRYHELGLDLLTVPTELGGQAAPLVTSLIAHEELAFGDPGAAVALGAAQSYIEAVLQLGDAAQQQRLLAPFALTTPPTGAIAFSEAKMSTTDFATSAKKDGNEFVLHGDKSFVLGGAADHLIVFAMLDGVPAAFAVPKSSAVKPGERYGLVGLEAVVTAPVSFENVRIPKENRLCGGDDFAKNVRRFFARIGLTNAARQVGLARSSYEFALAYTQERKAFGKPVAHFQAISFALADMHMDVESARWLLWRAATEIDRDLSTAAEAIVHANEAAFRVADQGVQLLGGAGFVKDYPAEKWLRDTKALALFSPPDEWLQLVTADGELESNLATALPSCALQPFFT